MSENCNLLSDYFSNRLLSPRFKMLQLSLKYKFKKIFRQIAAGNMEILKASDNKPKNTKLQNYNQSGLVYNA